MTIKLGKYTLTINVTSEAQPARRMTDITIDTVKRDAMINELGVNFDDIRARARQARLHRQLVLA